MITSSRSTFTSTHLCPNHINSRNLHKAYGECSFLRSRPSLQLLQKSPTKRSSNKDLIVRNIATPEAAADLVSSSSSAGGDLLSTFSLPTAPGLSDTPWIAGIAGLVVGVPLLIRWILRLTKDVDMAAEAVEKIADAVGKVAADVDEAAEELGEALPEGGINQVVNFVEDLAEETNKEAQQVEDLMNKVEELDEKLEKILEQESEGSEKA